ncbi:MAG TPA: hypothetical protein VMG82_31655 [Candidatus Sulfotelmatobacter sp.]|nr:hypothetical protein [Candidatus Sulfotelmatobacter sp.]
MTKLRPTWFLVSFVFLGAAASPKATDPCQLAYLPLTIAPDLKLAVVNHYLMFNPEVEGALFLRNESGESIYGITMLVIYEDQQSRPLFSIKYQASVKGHEHQMTNIQPSFQGTLTRPVRPGEVFNLSGTNLLTTTTVPAKAEISVVSLQLARTNVERRGVGTFRSDPILEEAPPQYPQLAISADDLSRDRLLKLSISPQGIVKTVDLVSEMEPSNPALTSVMDEMRKWRFFPAIRNGVRVTSDLFVLLRFRRAHALPVPVHDCFIGQGDKYPVTFVFVTVEPVPNRNGYLKFFYDKYEVSAWNGQFLGQEGFESTPWTVKPK